jgi:hypothetical protein
MPYFCLRVPTDGGKTSLAAKSVALVNNRLLQSEHRVILWLVPSKAIRNQTLAGLGRIDHPYQMALHSCLVQSSGFDRQDAAEFVPARTQEQAKSDFRGGIERIQITPVEVKLSEAFDISKVSKETKRKLKCLNCEKTQ